MFDLLILSQNLCEDTGSERQKDLHGILSINNVVSAPAFAARFHIYYATKSSKEFFEIHFLIFTFRRESLGMRG